MSSADEKYLEETDDFIHSVEEFSDRLTVEMSKMAPPEALNEIITQMVVSLHAVDNTMYALEQAGDMSAATNVAATAAIFASYLQPLRQLYVELTK